MAAKKAGRRDHAGTATNTPAGGQETARVTWRLGELPSSQHKTGLVGLVLLLRWLAQKPRPRGVLQIASLDSSQLTMEFDLAGLEWLFDEVYAAEEQEEEIESPDGTGGEGKSRQRETRKVNKTSRKIVPQGAFLAERDPAGPDGPWIKLWRDVVWGVLRSKAKSRAPFEKRARGIKSDEANEAWKALRGAVGGSVNLSGSYYIGAEQATADNIAFRDRERLKFLLHFWPFACDVSVPVVVVVDREVKSKRKTIKTNYVGYVLAFPDVADLLTFCDDYEQVLSNRSSVLAGYRPKEALLDLPAEAGLRLLSALRKRLPAVEGKKLTRDLVLGVDVFHLERDGNNVRVLSTCRVEPSDDLQDEYERIRTHFKDVLFRRQLLSNVLSGSPWYAGFDRLFSTQPAELFLRDRRREDARACQFPFDVQRQFEDVINEVSNE
jgi:CRISPR-associated protein Cmx8